MKSKGIIILAVVMALITTLLFNNYLDNLDKKYNTNKNVDVLVAKVDIKENQLITQSDVELKQVSQDSASQYAIKDLAAINNKFATTDIKQGEQLVDYRISDSVEEDKDVARKIEKGYRAVSIEANLVESVSNLIKPEDRVDIVYTESNKNNETNIKTELLFENVRVLAVGKSMNTKEDTKDTEANKQSNSKEEEYTAVTVELTNDDTLKLINCDEKGNIKFVLRGKVGEGE